MRPASRLGQAFLSPRGTLFVVVSDPELDPTWHVSEHWLHRVVAFAADFHQAFERTEGSVAEMEGRPGWTRLA